MGICVHFARACLMISKQPGIDCRPDARATSSLLAELTLSRAVVARLLLVHIKERDEQEMRPITTVHTPPTASTADNTRTPRPNPVQQWF